MLYTVGHSLSLVKGSAGKADVCCRLCLKARGVEEVRGSEHSVFYSVYGDIKILKCERDAVAIEKHRKGFIPFRINKPLLFERQCPL